MQISLRNTEAFSSMQRNYEVPFTLDDFEHGHLEGCELYLLETLIRRLNFNRYQYLTTGDRFYYWNMVELMPASYKGEKLCLK